jgi:hypothetical protein
MSEVHQGVCVQYAKCPDESDKRHWIVFDESTQVGRKAECVFCRAFVEIGEVAKGYVSQKDADSGFTKKKPTVRWGDLTAK